jgi:ADP-ribosyl-[dinitrogen reductase] hydrolase
LRFKFSKNPIAGSTDFFNAGNGSIMRLSPLVVRWWKNFSIYQDIAIRQSKTTHASPECLESCILLARIIASAIEGKGKNALDSGIGNAIDSILSLKAKKVISIANGDYKSFSREFIKSSGYVIDTLEAACWCVFTSDDFESAVLKAVNLGDDADTVGAVTGQIAGAVWGYSSIPDNWVKILYDHDRLHAIAEILYEAGE